MNKPFDYAPWLGDRKRTMVARLRQQAEEETMQKAEQFAQMQQLNPNKVFANAVAQQHSGSLGNVGPGIALANSVALAKAGGARALLGILEKGETTLDNTGFSVGDFDEARKRSYDPVKEEARQEAEERMGVRAGRQFTLMEQEQPMSERVRRWVMEQRGRAIRL